MVKDKLKESVLTAFTPNGDYVAILSANGTAKVSIAFFSSLQFMFGSSFHEMFMLA